MPIGFKSPVLPTERLPTLKLSNLINAIDNLKTELSDFDSYFINHPSDKPINPTMGELSYQE
jgi:oxepin-CoA hydrolase/3-oxo-5,6-dehydrosuberyl-CoA semialdehyde dehydrogenase